ncbi:hypothetical protein AADZ91_11130 [Colwelliaceae bacterium 6441]
MSNKKSNTDQLHDAKIFDKKDLHEDHIKAIDSLSQEEVEHLKSIGKKLNDVSPSVGYFL